MKIKVSFDGVCDICRYKLESYCYEIQAAAFRVTQIDEDNDGQSVVSKIGTILKTICPTCYNGTFLKLFPV